MSYSHRRVLDIPNEHLAEIFRFAIGDPRFRGKTRTIIQLVCRRWRAVMLNSKFLWSQITIGIEDLSLRIHPLVRSAAPVPNGPDILYISQCLTNAHGHPLDIIICIDDMPIALCQDTLPALRHGITLAHTHAIRWRSLHCKAPLWFFLMAEIDDFIDRDCLPQLETMSLIVNDGQTSTNDLLLQVALPESVRDLRLDLPSPRLIVTWGNITSFVGGFSDHIQIYNVLPQMVALNTLHLTHVESHGAIVPKRRITLDALRHLQLSHCAVFALSSLADKLRFPELKEFSLLDTKTYFHPLIIMMKSCAPNVITAAMADSLCHMFESSGAHVTALNVSGEPCAFFTQLCMNLGALVDTLRVEFSETDDWIADFFGKLTMSSSNPRVLLPNLVNLQVAGSNINYIFAGPILESLIISCWGQGRMARLEKLRLRRLRYQDDELDPSTEIGSDSLANSSLALTLWKFRSEGLNVQWLDGYLSEPHLGSTPGDVDVLDDTHGYIPRVMS